jgi:hypothetical protein
MNAIIPYEGFGVKDMKPEWGLTDDEVHVIKKILGKDFWVGSDRAR